MNESEAVEEFRVTLQNEYSRRLRRNQNYSLRSFARSLQVHHGLLSRILRGKRSVTAKMQQRLGPRLGVSNQANTDSQGTMHVLAKDTFGLIADWYHDAILELTRLSSNQLNPKEISKALGISQLQAQAALERLIRNGLLRTSAGKWRVTLENSTTIPNGSQSDEASRYYQTQMLEKAIDAIQTIPLDSRSNSSVTLAIDVDDLPELQSIIKKFRRELISFAQRKNVKPNSVYQLCISLFPLTKKTEVVK